MPITRRLFIGSAAAAAAIPAFPAGTQFIPPLPGDIKARVRSLMQANRLPAVAIAVVRDGAPAAAEGLGLISIPFAAPATARSLFHLGSVSKQFTAATVVALAREGRIGLDDPVGDHVRGLPPSLAGPPVRTLLSHLSGIPDYEGLPNFAADRAINRPTFVRQLAGMPIDFPPGTAWRYSNSAFVLLGYLIADVTGRTYHDAVRDRLLRPAGLEEGRFDDATALIPGRAEPYVPGADAIRRAPQMDPDYSGWPDGGMLISARDIARWEIGLQRGRPIPAADLALMTRPAMLSSGRSAGYGFGWYLDRAHGRDVHYHSGSVPGFMAFYLRVPALRLAAMAMTNLESPATVVALRRIVQELAEWAAPGSTFLSLPAANDDEPALTREALAMIGRGATPLDPARFAPHIARLLPDRAAGITPPNRAELGPPGAFVLVESFAEGAGRIRRYRATFGDRIEHFAFAYDRAGLIYRVRGL